MREKPSVIPLFAGLLVLICLPLGLSKYATGLLIQILIYSIFAMSFDLLLGYLGMLSFGHVAFWGLGIYAYGIINTRGLMPHFWFALAAAMAIGLIAALAIGVLVMRTTGVYFAFVNFAIAQLLWSTSMKWRSLTGGEDGISGITRPWNLEGLSFYYFILVFFCICFLLMRWITRCRYGKVLVGIRENPLRMQSLGYNIWLYKYSCYVFAGVFGTFAGFLFGCYNRFASPEDLAFTVTGMALLMVLIGGKASQVGSIVGAVIIILLYQFVSAYTEHWLFVVGIIFVLVVLFVKEGVSGYLSAIWKRLRHGSYEAR
jgi:branched-chain amino acid transport system permease protein